MPNTKFTLKNLPIFFGFYQRGKNSPNLVTLVETHPQAVKPPFCLG